MKKTFSINIAGFPFIIDEDAYTLLNDYLKTIEHAFSRQEDAREIVSDIEGRVAELLMEQVAEGSQIITINQVEEVITRIGKPEDMLEEDETTIFSETSNFTGPTPPP
ncbi:MAG: PspC family transcriptional regulator, partial [Muribaculaceae bacterium]|nr:PspC family transcriptional regulator [Muribaculaceae bacterium]